MRNILNSKEDQIMFKENEKKKELLIEKLNREQKPLNEVKNQDLIKISRKNLYEEGKRLTFMEAFLIMISVAIGIGYIQMSTFYLKYSYFYWYPIMTCAFNAVFGVISIYLLLDAYKLH